MPRTGRLARLALFNNQLFLSRWKISEEKGQSRSISHMSPYVQLSCGILKSRNPLVIVYNHSELYGSWHVSLQGTCCHFSVEFLERILHASRKQVTFTSSAERKGRVEAMDSCVILGDRNSLGGVGKGKPAESENSCRKRFHRVCWLVVVLIPMLIVKSNTFITCKCARFSLSAPTLILPSTP